jgi:hypothetical protein
MENIKIVNNAGYLYSGGLNVPPYYDVSKKEIPKTESKVEPVHNIERIPGNARGIKGKSIDFFA